MTDRVKYIIAILAACLFAVSCKTTPKPWTSVNYGSDRGVLHEIEQARKLLETDPLAALARSWALRTNTDRTEESKQLFTDAADKALLSFNLAVEGGRWAEARKTFTSLSALSLAPEGWTESKINEKQREQWLSEGNQTLAYLESVRDSTPEDEAPSPRLVADMVQGTVTVWVDRGIRIQNGVGYADRVIGSGFFIDTRGYFITNYHVIASEVDPKYEGYSRLFVKLPGDNDTRIPARVIGWDEVLDLALVKTEITPKVIFSLGSSEDLKVGNRIYAIGSPAGLEQTLTSGIVSAQNRRLLSLGSILQIDAPINQGNSGGPIVDEAGLVQAVVFAGIEPYEGLNFAIPVEYLRIILPSLYSGGPVSHPWLSAFGRTAVLPGSPDNAGVSLLYSIPAGPLEIAGIPVGTVLTAMNGTPVKTLEELQDLIVREESGSIVRLDGIRPEDQDGDRKLSSWFVHLFPRPENPGVQIIERDTKVRSLLPLAGFNLERVGNTQKYLVGSVVKGSVADESGFSEQDVIEIREFKVDEKEGFVEVELMTKRRKSGYLDAYIGFFASLDSPSYF